MLFGVSIITKNRTWGKAFNRIFGQFKKLELMLADIELESAKGIIIIFEDAAPDFRQETKNKDRIYQMSIGLPFNRLSLKPENDKELLATCAEQIEKILEIAPFTKSALKTALLKFASWREQIDLD